MSILNCHEGLCSSSDLFLFVIKLYLVLHCRQVVSSSSVLSLLIVKLYLLRPCHQVLFSSCTLPVLAMKVCHQIVCCPSLSSSCVHKFCLVARFIKLRLQVGLLHPRHQVMPSSCALSIHLMKVCPQVPAYLSLSLSVVLVSGLARSCHEGLSSSCVLYVLTVKTNVLKLFLVYHCHHVVSSSRVLSALVVTSSILKVRLAGLRPSVFSFHICVYSAGAEFAACRVAYGGRFIRTRPAKPAPSHTPPTVS